MKNHVTAISMVKNILHTICLRVPLVLLTFALVLYITNSYSIIPNCFGLFQTMIIDNQVRDNATVVAALFVTSAAFLNLYAAGMYTSAKIMEEFLQKHKRKQHLNKFHRRDWVREHFSSFRERASSTLFRRMFRMPENTFEILCKRIEASVGEEEFCSENFIITKLEEGNSKLARIYQANKKSHARGWICGEVKVTIALWFLAGASYADILHIFGVWYSHSHRILHEVCEHWLCKDWVSKYILEAALDDANDMLQISKVFATKGRSQGILAGIIGALDGWLVKICKPKLCEGVRNPGTYFSRKGFFALNVQCIVDRNKKIIWRAINAKGSEHDSKAFKNTKLCKKLEGTYRKDDCLLNQNEFGILFYLISDSAYALRPFLLTPYDNAASDSAEDVFNFIHSSSRIFVECAFGEIDARFRIFWKPLRFKLDRHKYIINACLR